MVIGRTMWKQSRRTCCVRVPCVRVHSHMLRELLLFRLPHIRLYHTIVPCKCSCEECGDMTGEGVGWWSDGTVTMLVLLDIPGDETSSGGVTSSPILPFSAIFMALPLISLGYSCEKIQCTTVSVEFRDKITFTFIRYGDGISKAADFRITWL